MVAQDVFLFLGTDSEAKQEKVSSLANKFFPPQLKEFNYSVIFGDDKELSPKFLNEIFLSLPSIGAKKRLLVIRNASSLKKANFECVCKAIKAGLRDLALVLDVADAESEEDFVSEFSKLGCQVVRFKSEKPINIFDLGRAIMAHNADRALNILTRIVAKRERPEKIVGTVFWQWERSFSQKHTSLDVYKKGLKIILEADVKLKSSSSAYARQHLILEALIVKLCYLLPKASLKDGQN